MLIRGIEGDGEYTDGPCNSVNRILAAANEDGVKGYDIKDLVLESGMEDLDVFCPTSSMRLVPTSTLPKREIVSCPRVGLTLKRYDAQKEKYWMADYRFLSLPTKTKKMKDFMILSMLDKGKTVDQVSSATGSKVSRIVELKSDLAAGKAMTCSVKALHKEKMGSRDWANVYGLHNK